MKKVVKFTSPTDIELDDQSVVSLSTKSARRVSQISGYGQFYFSCFKWLPEQWISLINKPELVSKIVYEPETGNILLSSYPELIKTIHDISSSSGSTPIAITDAQFGHMIVLRTREAEEVAVAVLDYAGYVGVRPAVYFSESFGSIVKVNDVLFMDYSKSSIDEMAKAVINLLNQSSGFKTQVQLSLSVLLDIPCSIGELVAAQKAVKCYHKYYKPGDIISDEIERIAGHLSKDYSDLVLNPYNLTTYYSSKFNKSKLIRDYVANAPNPASTSAWLCNQWMFGGMHDIKFANTKISVI